VRSIRDDTEDTRVSDVRTFSEVKKTKRTEKAKRSGNETGSKKLASKKSKILEKEKSLLKLLIEERRTITRTSLG